VRTAREHGARGITVIEHDGRETFVSYRELLERAARVRGGLRALGKGRGEYAVLQVPTLAGHFVAFWGCVLAGVIPVTVAIPPSYSEPNAVLAKLRGVHDLLGAPAVIGARATLSALRDIPSLHDGAPPPRVTPLVLEDLESAAPDHDFFRAAPEDVMFLQLSSGSTGVPKVIQERHSALLHHVYAAALHNGYSADDVDLSFLPLDHVVPILTCHLKDVCLGVSQIHVRTERILRDPLLWLDLLESRRATHTWSPNFGYKLVVGALAASPDRSWDLSRVRFFMNAGEQVTLPVVSDFLRLTAPFGVSPRAMQPAFGMAEVCTCMTWENHFTPDTGSVRIAKLSLGGALREAAPGEEAITFVGLGPPMPGVEVRIAGDTNETLPEMTIGRLQIRGAVVMPGYLRNDEANREALPGEGWLDSGDLGFLHHGRLFVTGRKKEMILVRGANFYCHEIEDVAGRVPGVLPTFVAACAVEDPGSGTESVAVFFVPESEVCTAALLRAVRAAVTKELGVTPRLVVPLDRAGFPKTTSGKIQRTDLKKRLARGDLDDLVRRTDLLLENEHTLPPWFFGWVFRPAAAPPPAPLPPAIVLGRGPRAEALAADLGARYVAVEQGASAGQSLPDGAPAPLVVHAIGLDAADERASLVETAWDAVSLARPPSSGDPSPASAPRRLCFVTEGAVSTAAGELPSPARAALLGLLPSLAEEQQGLFMSLIDVDRDAAAIARAADEIRCGSDEPVVALRGGERLVRRLVPAITGRDPGPSTPRGTGPYPAAPPTSRGGLYLLTGGLGGVGAALAAELLVHRGARLLLTGRSALEEEVREDTGGLAPARTADERRRTFARLAALGPVLFAAADVTDREAMSRAVAAAESHFGRRLDGVIHLAGVFPARLAAEETRDTLADTFDPKVRGALVLDALVPDDRLFVAVSSVYGAFGGAASGAYSAASSALDAVIAARRARGMSRSFSVACSLFRDLGMSRDFSHEDRAAALGYCLMDAPRAVTSLLAVAAGPAGEVLIGLAPEKVNVRRHLDGAPMPLEEITVYCTGTPKVHRVEVTDHFGARAAPRIVPALELPSGREAGGPSARAATEPRTPTEKVIAALWREVLQVDPIDLDTSFFALGGQSILLVQVLERTNRHFGTRLAVVDLFRRPTVRSLADMIDHLGTRDVRESVQEKTARAGSRADRQREAALARASARARGGR
jgi:nonribosomal peptide synthetase DhbF